MARIATVEEMVGLAIFPPSPAASFMTGVCQLVDRDFEQVRRAGRPCWKGQPQRRLSC